MSVNYAASLLSNDQLEILPANEAALWESYLEQATTRLGMNLRDAMRTLPDLEHYLTVKDTVHTKMYAGETKTTLSGVPEQEVVSGCLNYVGKLTSDGYGPHRMTYKKFFGYDSIPAGLQIDHMCDNRACQNPLHMAVTTQNLNTRRAKLQDVCQNGHPAKEHADKNGRCATCRSAKNAERYQLKKLGLWVSSRGRKTETHCANGHEWTEESVYVRPDMTTECMVCREDYRRRSESKNQRTFALAS